MEFKKVLDYVESYKKEYLEKDLNKNKQLKEAFENTKRIKEEFKDDSVRKRGMRNENHFK